MNKSSDLDNIEELKQCDDQQLNETAFLDRPPMFNPLFPSEEQADSKNQNEVEILVIQKSISEEDEFINLGDLIYGSVENSIMEEQDSNRQPNSSLRLNLIEEEEKQPSQMDVNQSGKYDISLLQFHHVDNFRSPENKRTNNYQISNLEESQQFDHPSLENNQSTSHSKSNIKLLGNQVNFTQSQQLNDLENSHSLQPEDEALDLEKKDMKNNSKYKVLFKEWYNNNKKAAIIFAVILSLVLLTVVVISIFVPKRGKPSQVRTISDPNMPKSILVGSQLFELIGDHVYKNPVTGQATVPFPTTKEKMIKALSSPHLRYLPIAFYEREQADYRVITSSKTESDADKYPLDQSEQSMNFNASFYTLNVTKTYYTILTHHVQDGFNESQKRILQPFTLRQLQENATALTKQFAESTEKTPDPDTLTSDEDRFNFIQNQTKISICQVDFGGNLKTCLFLKQMKNEDMRLSVKFLKLYIPDLIIDQHRLLNEEGQGKTDSGPHTLEVTDDSLQVSQEKNEQTEDSTLSFTKEQEQQNDISFESGKPATVNQNEGASFIPSSTGGFSKNQAAISKIGQTCNITLVLISHVILDQAAFNENMLKISEFQWTTIVDPVNNFSKPDIIPNNFNPQEGLIEETPESENNRRILFERYLGPAYFQSINAELAQMNILFITLKAGFRFTDLGGDNYESGLYIDPEPFPTLTLFKKQVQADIGGSIIKYRHFKIVFEQIMKKLNSLVRDVDSLVQTLLNDNFDMLDEFLGAFTRPLNTIENNFIDYTENVIKKATELKQCLDISASINEVVDIFTTQNIEMFLSNSQSLILSLGQSQFMQAERLYEYLLSTGLKYHKDVISQINMQRNKLNSQLDDFLDIIDENCDSYFSKVNDNFDFIINKVESMSSNSFLLQFNNHEIISSITNLVKKMFNDVIKPSKEIQAKLKNSLRIQTHMIFEKTKSSITAKLNQIVEYLQLNEGTQSLDQQYIEWLNPPIIDQSVVTQHFVNQFVNLPDEMSDLIEDVLGKVVNDIKRAAEIVQEIVTCGDEKKFFQNTYAQLKTDIGYLNKTLFINVYNQVSTTLDQTQFKLSNLVKEIKAFPDNLKTEFNKPISINAPSGVININDELHDVQAIIQGIDDITNKFSQLTKITQIVEQRTAQVKTLVNKLNDSPKRIKQQFEFAVSEIKMVASKLSLSMKIPTDQLEQSLISFDNIKDNTIAYIKSKVVTYTQNQLKDIGKKYGTSFLSSLSSQLDSKLKTFLPSLPRRKLYSASNQKEIQLYWICVPLPLGLLIISVSKVFKMGVNLYMDFSKGNLAMVVDPYLQFFYQLNMGWNLFLVETAVAIRGTVFDGSIPTQAGVQLFSLSPTAFINSAIQFSAFTLSLLTIYRILVFRIRWVCWYIGRRRCRIRICVPIFFFQWSEWRVISNNSQVVGFSYRKSLIDKSYALQLM